MEKEYLLKKWLSNELSPSEQEALAKTEDYDLYERILSNAEYFKASHFSQMDTFESMQARIAHRPKVKKLSMSTYVWRVAAVLVVGLGLFATIFFTQTTTVTTLASKKATIELPDSSRVILNASSKLSYSKNRWNAQREVDLEGEAYFKVAKGTTFDVVTDEGVVTVVGTEFNVKQRDSYFEVQCYEGIVRVSAPSFSKKLLAGDTFRLVAGAVSYNTTSFTIPQWTKNVSHFDQVPFSEVIEELERQYDIEVIFDSDPAGFLFSGGFVHDNLPNALQSITQPLELKYTMESLDQVRLLKRE